MAQRVYRSFQALLMLLLGMFLAEKLLSGKLSWYINLRFWPLTIAGILFLGLMAQTLIAELRKTRAHAVESDHTHESHEHHEHAPLWSNLVFIFVPLVIGILIPARPLDASAIEARGYTTTAPLVKSSTTSSILETASEQRSILDWVRLFNSPQIDSSGAIGQTASVVGFVFRDEQLKAGQFYVGRFVVSCCSADGYAVAMIVEWPEAESLEKDTWVMVKGPAGILTLGGQNAPIITAESVEIVTAPDQPYLYP